jgi:hypothetical protein
MNFIAQPECAGKVPQSKGEIPQLIGPLWSELACD